jgi:hypothetical protein
MASLEYENDAMRIIGKACTFALTLRAMRIATVDRKSQRKRVMPTIVWGDRKRGLVS